MVDSSGDADEGKSAPATCNLDDRVAPDFYKTCYTGYARKVSKACDLTKLTVLFKPVQETISFCTSHAARYDTLASSRTHTVSRVLWTLK